MAEYQFTAHYTEDLVRLAAKKFMVRRVLLNPWTWVITLFLTISLMVYLWQGDRSWKVGFLGSSLALLICAIVALWRAHLMNSRAKLRRMQHPTINFLANENGIFATSGSGSVNFPWSLIQEVWPGAHFWMFFLAPNDFFIVPIDQVSVDALAFICLRARCVDRP